MINEHDDDSTNAGMTAGVDWGTVEAPKADVPQPTPLPDPTEPEPQKDPVEPEPPEPELKNRWVICQPANRPSYLECGKVVALPKKGPGTIVEFSPVGQMTAQSVRLVIQDSEMVRVLPDGEARTLFLERVAGGFISRPYIVDERLGEPVALRNCTMLSKSKAYAHPAVVNGKEFSFVLEHDHPSTMVKVTLEDPLDYKGIEAWMKQPTGISVLAPRVFYSSDTPGLRVFQDRNWEPFKVPFAGRFLTEVIPNPLIRRR